MRSRAAIQEYVQLTALSDLLVGLLGSIFVACAAQVAIHLPWLTPVPFTFQVPAVLLLAALTGSRRAALAVSFYLIEGACGFPVFTHGSAGLFHLFGPTGGYLFSFLPVSHFAGCAFERFGHQKIALNFTILIAGSAAVLLCGMLWLGLFLGVENGWNLGVKPFLLTDVLKICALTLLLSLDRRTSDAKSD